MGRIVRRALPLLALGPVASQSQACGRRVVGLFEPPGADNVKTKVDGRNDHAQLRRRRGGVLEVFAVTIAEELLAISDGASAALSGLEQEDVQAPLSRLESACNDAKRAWSGSNIGYHANVYWEGLEPRSPVGEFNPEWGLKDAWPTHQPARGWTVMDAAAARALILSQAGDPNVEQINEAIDKGSESFTDLKESAMSILMSIRGDDQFIKRALDGISKLFVASQRAIANSALPSGQVMTRDSAAMAQGLRVASHQYVSAIYLSATVTKNALKELKRATHQAALHLERFERSHRKMTATGKTVFIGHGRSNEWRTLKDFLKDRLHLSADEFNSSSAAGIPTPTRLEEMLESAAFAFLMMTAEDEQPDGTLRARENVVHEAGLFQGRLGFRKAIILLEDGCEEFSNIRGLGQIRFPKNNVSAKFDEIRQVLEREGLIAAL
jgi:predicted nucleotide-binding protein